MRLYILHLGWYPGNYPKENNFAFHAVWEQAHEQNQLHVPGGHHG